MNATPKPDIRFSIKVERSTEYHSFVGWAQYMTEPDKWNESGLRNPCSWDRGALAPLADLQISAQANRDDKDVKWYAFKLEYRSVHSVDLQRAEVMVKMLRSIERKMAKLNEQLGYPTDLADFAARCAIVLGATDKTPFGLWNDTKTINGTHYRWTDVDGLRSFTTNALNA